MYEHRNSCPLILIHPATPVQRRSVPHIRDTYTPKLQRHTKQYNDRLRNKIQTANEACQFGDYETAIRLFTDIIGEERKNPILFCNRSAAYVRMREYEKALDDAATTITLDPEWQKGYYRQAVALKHMGRYTECLASYASALAHDTQSNQLLQALIEAALKSPVQDTLEVLLEQLDIVSEVNRPFASVALIGQEMLSTNDRASAITVLESALYLTTDDVLLKASVYSALSSAYWNSDDPKTAIHFMKEELRELEDFGDLPGSCRVHGNLGGAYYTMECLDDAKHHHNLQYELALSLQDRKMSCEALNALGQDCVSLGEFKEALTSHKKCALLRKQMGNRTEEGRQLGCVANVYSLMGEFEKAEICFKENLQIFKTLRNVEEICKSFNSLGCLYQNMEKYQYAIKIFQEYYELAGKHENHREICRALSGLGHTCRMNDNLNDAEKFHVKQMKKALELEDLSLEKIAHADLGVTYQHLNENEKALECHKSNLGLCRRLRDEEGEGKAFGNIGNVYQVMKDHAKAVKYYALAMARAIDIHDKYAQATLHGNLGVAYESMKMKREAEEHYEQHLQIAKEKNFLRSECVAENNMGSFFSNENNYKQAAQHLENYLSVAVKIGNKKEMCTAMQKLAHAYFKLNDFKEAEDYYAQAIDLANNTNDVMSLATAYCSLGFLYVAMGKYEKAVRCQKLFLASGRERRDTRNVCKALGNLATVSMKMRNRSEALEYFTEQLKVASKSEAIQADCYRQRAQMLIEGKSYEEALSPLESEISLRVTLKDDEKLLDSMMLHATALNALKDYSGFYKRSREIFALTKELKNMDKCREICHMIGMMNVNTKNYAKAISAFRLELKCSSDALSTSVEIADVHCKLSDCYEKQNDIENALKHSKRHHSIVQRLAITKDESKACERLSALFSRHGDPHSALLYAEKRLVCCQELQLEDICDAYTSLAQYHIALHNYGTADSYYKQILTRAGNSPKLSYSAYSGLGDVAIKREEYQNALGHYFKADGCAGEGLFNRAETSINIANCYNKLGDLQTSLKYYQQAIQICQKKDFKLLQLQSCGGIGKSHHLLKSNEESISYLKMAAVLCEPFQFERTKCLYRLALKLYIEGDHNSALNYFEKSVNLEPGSLEEFYFVRSSLEMLQKVYIEKGLHEEALYCAEKSVALSLRNSLKNAVGKNDICHSSKSEFIQKLRSVSQMVCYYSVVIGQIYCWIVRPNVGIVKFWSKDITENSCSFEGIDLDNVALHYCKESNAVLKSHITKLRKSLDIEDQQTNGNESATVANMEIISSNKNEDFRFRYKQPNKKFRENKSNLDSAFNSPVKTLYDLLLSDFDSFISKEFEQIKSLKMIVPNEITLVPFSILRGRESEPFLNQRFNISYAHSLSLLAKDNLHEDDGQLNETALVFCDQDGQTDGSLIHNVMTSSTLVRDVKSEDELVTMMSNSAINHLAVNISDNAFRIPYKAVIEKMIEGDLERLDPDVQRQISQPDILMPLDKIRASRCKLFAFGLGAQENSDVIHLFSTALLEKGCKAVVTSQWEIPRDARLQFLSTFYKKMNNAKLSIFAAFHESVKELQSLHEYRHPVNWAGLLLLGRDSVLCESGDKYIEGMLTFLRFADRNSLKIVLHLVEAALKRLAQDHSSSLYITKESIVHKIPSVEWTPLLEALGFRQECSHKQLSDVIFFPEYQNNAVLNKCCNTLYALLGLNPNGLRSISRLYKSESTGSPLLKLLQDAIAALTDETIEITCSLGVWRLDGCHEFLSSLGFDVFGVGKSEVVLKPTPNKRMLQCAVQCMKDLFELNNSTVDQTPNKDGVGGMQRKLRQRNQENDFLSGMRKAVSNVDVSNMVLYEDDDAHNSVDFIDGEDVETFPNHFETTKRTSTIHEAVNENEPSEQLNVNALSQRRQSKQNVPEEWRRLRLGSEYFENNASIDSISIKDSLLNSVRPRSGSITSSKSSRSSTVNSEEEGDGKKRKWFRRNLKKAGSMDNLLDIDEKIGVWQPGFDDHGNKFYKKRNSLSNILALQEKENMKKQKEKKNEEDSLNIERRRSKSFLANLKR